MKISTSFPSMEEFSEINKFIKQAKTCLSENNKNTL